jgi:hypothetical protein
MDRSDIWHALCVFSKGRERMLTESHVGSQSRARALLSIVRPTGYPKTTAREASAALENGTGACHRSAWQSAVTAMCLLWFCLNAIPASGHMDLHVWLNIVAAVVLAYSGVWSGLNQRGWLRKRIASLSEEMNLKATENDSPLGSRLPSRSLKPTS